ncbi:MAG: globin domain-containing protein [Pseudomonadota bacterium]
MTLTDRQIEEIERSFRQIEPISKLAAELFCARFFASAPEAQVLVGDDALQHREALFETLAIVVDGLREPERMMARMRDLAGRSVVFGITPAHYAAAGTALIWTLEQALADAFTAETREAWEALYAAVSEEMVASAYQRADGSIEAE